MILHPRVLLVSLLFIISALFESAEAQVFDASAIYQAAVRGVVLVESQGGTGSGFFINHDGWLVTNRHVIEAEDGSLENASEIQVYTADYADTLSVVQIIDASNGKKINGYSHPDLVFLRTDFSPKLVLPLSPDANTPVGEQVERIGNELSGNWVQANGSVSTNNLPEFLQIQTPVNHGNSGGPLLNKAGQVVGVVTLTFQNIAENTNFATKSSVLKERLAAHNIKFYTRGIVKVGESPLELNAEQVNRDRDSLNVDNDRLRIQRETLDQEKDKFRQQQIENAATQASAIAIRKELANKESELQIREDSLVGRQRELESAEASLRYAKKSFQQDYDAAQYLSPPRFAIELMGGVGYWYVRDTVSYAQPRFTLTALHRFDLNKQQGHESDAANRIGVQYGVHGVFDGKNGILQRGFAQELSILLDLHEVTRFQFGRVVSRTYSSAAGDEYWLVGFGVFVHPYPLPITIYGSMVSDNRFFQNSFVVGLSIGYGDNFLQM